MKRHRGKTAEGRRIRDLYLDYLHALGNPQSAIVQAKAAKAAELVVAAEIARAKLIRGDGDANQLVRMENLADRALRGLGLPNADAAAVHVPLRERLAATGPAPNESAASSPSLRERLSQASDHESAKTTEAAASNVED